MHDTAALMWFYNDVCVQLKYSLMDRESAVHELQERLQEVEVLVWLLQLYHLLVHALITAVSG